MVIDVIDLSPEQFAELTAWRKGLVRTAQKRKNELRRKLENSLSEYAKTVYSADMKDSSLIAQMREKLEAEFDCETQIIAEQLQYDLAPGGGQGSGDVGYVVDYSLPYVDRYALVREYYLTIPDSTERLERYKADEVAKKYLGSYYGTLYDVLSTYES